MGDILRQGCELALARLQRDSSVGLQVTITARILTAQEALGDPGRSDFPLQTGREHLIEAVCGWARGHAFTDAPAQFAGSLAELLARTDDVISTRALQVAALNALVCRWGLVTDTVHCRDDGPERCAREIPALVAARWPHARTVVMVGCQPAMADVLAPRYALTILDADPARVGTTVAGAPVLGHGRTAAQALHAADAVLATGSTLANGTIDGLIRVVGLPRLAFFGVTIAGAAALLNLPRLCPCAQQGVA